jgi:hypothetical protein
MPVTRPARLAAAGSAPAAPRLLGNEPAFDICLPVTPSKMGKIPIADCEPDCSVSNQYDIRRHATIDGKLEQRARS